jgi:hypothetical protein
MKFNFYADPGHGWAKVPVQMLVTLGIDQDISPYSYLSSDGRHAFLEEDLDLGTFIFAVKAKGYVVEFRFHHTDNPSRIRNYPGYQKDWVAENAPKLRK